MDGSGGSGQNVYPQGQTYRGYRRTGRKWGDRRKEGRGGMGREQSEPLLIHTQGRRSVIL